MSSFMANMSTVSVGVIGYGGSSKLFHLPYIQAAPAIKIYAILQRVPAPVGLSPPGSHCTIDYPEAKHYQDLDKFLADKGIDLVLICTGPETHAELAIACLNAKKHGE